MIRSKGSVSYPAMLIIAFLAYFIIDLNDIRTGVLKDMEDQNKKDAHMLSVIGLYKETLDTVTRCNKQLKRLAALGAVLAFVPGAQTIAPSFNAAGKGIKWYQDFVLNRLRIYAPVLDLSLRRKNRISLLANYHVVHYKRKRGFSLFGLFSVPPLIEIKSDVFSTACVKHRGRVTNSSVCVDHDKYKNVRTEWFAPTQGVWEVALKNAY